MTENALKPYVIGLDLGGTNSVFGIVDARGEIKATTAIKTGGYVHPGGQRGEQGRPPENHPLRHAAAGRQLLCRVHLYYAVRFLQPHAVRPVCSGGHGMGGHQRQQSAHGGGNVQRQ